MKLLISVITVALLLMVLAVGVLFAVQNTDMVALDLVVLKLPERSIALWVLLAFALGGVIGMLTSMGLVLRLRTRLASIRRQLARQEKQASRQALAEQTPAG
jgi:putative membrane protein